MIGRKHRDKVSNRDFVAFADGTLPEDRRERVQRAVAASPELSAQLEAQRRVLTAIGDAAGESAPVALRARLELARDPRPRSRLWPAIRARVGTVTVIGSLAVAAAAFAAAVVLATGGGGVGAPTVASAATLGVRPAMAVVYVPAEDRGALPGISAAGVPFPDWRSAFGFRAVGVRHDRLAGRLATTVFYVGAGERVAYTIVSGAPLGAGTAVSTVVWNGTRVSNFSSGQRAVATWVRDGHTCILSAPSPMRETLVRLAAWKDPAGVAHAARYRS